MAPKRSRHLLSWLFLALGTCAFFAPQLVNGSTQYDGVDVHYSSQRYFSDELHAGHLPFWTPFIFAGFPFLADVQVGAWYPLNWPFFVAGIQPRSISLELLLHTFIACAGAYALGMRLLRTAPAALGCAVCYGFSGYFAAHSQHVGMYQTAAWLPWLVLVVDRMGERIRARELGCGALIGAAVALPGHFQVALYVFSGSAGWAILQCLVRRAPGQLGRALVALATAAAGGGALGAIMILPGLELVRRSLRMALDGADVDLGYFHLESLYTLVWPDYYGLLSGKYIGPGDVTQHYFYAGVLLVPLALVGVAHARARSAALCLGLPFLWYAAGPDGGLFNVVARLPGFASVELPMHGWFLPALALALLGGAGIYRLPRFVGLAVVLVLFLDVLWVNCLSNPLAFARQSFDELYGPPLRAFDQRRQSAAPPVLRLYGPPLAAVGYRNHALQSRLETTYGYNPLELARYSAYIDAAEHNPQLIAGLAATHRLNPDGSLTPDTSALPRAYFARNLSAVEDDADVLRDLDPARQTFVGGSLPPVQSDPAANVVIVEESEDHLTLRFQTRTPNILRLAVPFFPGWHAHLDGRELPIVPVDYAFTGVVVPAGAGDVRLSYMPRYFATGAAISTVALLLTVLAIGVPSRSTCVLRRSKRFIAGLVGGRGHSSRSKPMTDSSAGVSAATDVTRSG